MESSLARAWTRLPRLLTVAIIVGLGISQLVLTLGDWHLRDMDAYWDAAVRLRNGDPLYPVLASTEASDVYRYAPWFAWAWVPVTALPREYANVLWSAVLLLASAAALSPLARDRAWLAVAFFAPVLVGISAIGNVQPLIVAALVLGLERRSGPVWVAATASLKVVPILFVVIYAIRGQWLRAAIAVVLAAALVAPMLTYDLSAYPTGADAAAMLIRWPIIYAVALGSAIVVSARLARSPFGWLAAAAAACLALPRFFVYDVTFLLAGRPAPNPHSSREEHAAR